jgi:hypothetical protein
VDELARCYGTQQIIDDPQREDLVTSRGQQDDVTATAEGKAVSDYPCLPLHLVVSCCNILERYQYLSPRELYLEDHKACLSYNSTSSV